MWKSSNFIFKAPNKNKDEVYTELSRKLNKSNKKQAQGGLVGVSIWYRCRVPWVDKTVKRKKNLLYFLCLTDQQFLTLHVHAVRCLGGTRLGPRVTSQIFVPEGLGLCPKPSRPPEGPGRCCSPSPSSCLCLECSSYPHTILSDWLTPSCKSQCHLQTSWWWRLLIVLIALWHCGTSSRNVKALCFFVVSWYLYSGMRNSSVTQKMHQMTI